MIPDMDSISEDFPALCEPMTAIWGKSMSTCTLHWDEEQERLVTVGKKQEQAKY